MPRENPSLRRNRPGHELTPERLFSILSNMYGDELARKFYRELTGQKAPDFSYDEKEDQNVGY